MAIQAGERIPEIEVQVASEGGIEKVKIGELLAGKKVVLFAVPGAFTPTCSVQHLPGYVDGASDLDAKGVDAILCLSVNDAFVMGAWGKEHGTEGKVTMVADGSAELTKALGLDFDASNFGMGVRSQRYAAIIDDGVVQSIHVEKPMKFEVSGAEAILAQL